MVELLVIVGKDLVEAIAELEILEGTNVRRRIGHRKLRKKGSL